MPRILMSIPDNSKTTGRHVHTDVVRDLIDLTGFVKGAEVTFTEQMGNVRNRNSYDRKAKNVLRSQYSNVVFVSTEERTDEQQTLARLRSSKMNTPVLEDEKLGLKVVPLYSPYVTTLNLRFRCQSQVALDTWARELSIRDKLKPLSYQIDLQYNYAIPITLSEYIKHIWELREAQGGYGDTEDEYIELIRQTPLVKRYNRSGGYFTTVINELQKNVIGDFTSEFMYNEKAKDQGIYEMEATFTFRHEKPVGFVVDFPFIVHNQLIDAKYIDKWIQYKDTSAVEEDRALSNRVLEATPVDGNKKNRFDDGVPRTIEFDDWYPKEPYPNTRTLLLVPIMVDPDDPHAVFNLDTDITDDLLNENIKNYMKKYPEQTHKYLDGPYFIELFGIDHEQHHLSFTLDNSLEMRSDVLPMDIRTRYYLRISVITDHVSLPNSVIRNFLKSKEDTYEAMWGIVPGIAITKKYTPGALHSPDDVFVTVKSYNDVLREIDGTSEVFKALPDKSWLTVMTANIIARRQD